MSSTTPPLPVLQGVRIAQIIECDGPGGAERVVTHLASGLVARGAEVVAFLPRGTGGWLGQQLHGSAVTIQQFDIARTFRPGFAGWLTQSLRDHRIDLVHSHEFTFAVHGAWSAWRMGIGHVTTIHGGRYWAGAWRRRALFRMAVRLGGELAAVSETLRSHLAEDLRIPETRISYIPNGVPCSGGGNRAALREELGLPPDAPLALAIGNLYPVKGHRVLLDALGSLRERHPGLHVAIAGRGGEESALLEQAKELDIVARVHLLGLRKDVPDLLAAADLFVMPSLSEGLPMALLEAMCSGKAVIASAVGAIPAVLEHGEGGMLVAPGDAGALSEALDRLLSQPDRGIDMAERARQHAKQHFSLDRMVERYLALYARFLRSPAP